MGGVVLCSAVVGVALNPSDVRPKLHGVTAYATFLSGIAYSTLTCVIKSQAHEAWGWVCAAMILSLICLTLMVTYQNAMLHALLGRNGSFDMFNSMDYTT